MAQRVGMSGQTEYRGESGQHNNDGHMHSQLSNSVQHTTAWVSSPCKLWNLGDSAVSINWKMLIMEEAAHVWRQGVQGKFNFQVSSKPKAALST